MAAHRLVFIHLAFLCSSISYSQGWQFIGPDSLSWQNVSYVSAKWTSPTLCRLAASCPGKGIAILPSNRHWTYPMRDWYSEQMRWGMSYYYYEFSKWDDTVGFVGYADLYTEPAYFISRSYVAGTTSQPTPSGCWRTPLNVIFAPNSDSLMLASVCGLHRSTNRGRTWDTLGRNSTGVSSAKLLGFDEFSNRVLYLSEIYLGSPVGARLLRSSNQSSVWDTLFSVPTDQAYGHESPFSIVARSDTLILGLKARTDGIPKGIYQSTNGGADWTHPYSASSVVGVTRSRVTPNTLFAASEEGILKSTDFGATWTMHNNALPTRRLTSLIISPYSDTMFVSTETHGVLKVWNFLTDVDESKTVPTQFVLHQNYPNPFNPTTTIRFGVGHRSSVCLKVFDLLGREVAMLVNEEMQPGSYEKTFSGDGLVSGVYLYRLQAGSFTQSEKLLLLR